MSPFSWETERGWLVAGVTVRILPGGVTRRVEASTVRELLEALGLDEESHVVLRGGRPLLAGDRLRDGDEVVVVRVLSGG